MDNFKIIDGKKCRMTCDVCKTWMDDTYIRRIVRVWDGEDDDEGHVTTKLYTCIDCYPPKCKDCSIKLGTYAIYTHIFPNSNELGGSTYRCQNCIKVLEEQEAIIDLIANM